MTMSASTNTMSLLKVIFVTRIGLQNPFFHGLNFLTFVNASSCNPAQNLESLQRLLKTTGAELPQNRL